MEQLDRDKIRKNIVTLSTMVNVNVLVDVLISRGVIDREFFDRIKSQYSNSLERERNQEFFLRYTKRGPEAFQILVESLRTTGHISEAQRLESTERNRTSVSSLESPTESEETSNSSSSNASSSVGHRFVAGESPVEASSSSTGSSNTTGSFNASTVHWANRIEAISREFPLTRRLSDLTMGDLPPLQIVVKHATIYNQGKISDDDAYPMMSNPKGFALIVNNIDFLGDPNSRRTGAEVDSENLDKLLQGLGFETTVRRNVNKDDLLNTNTGILNRFVDQFHNKSVDACLVAFMSHGTEELIRTSDPEKIDDPRYNHWHLYEDIIQRFNNRQCPILMDKPKLFIVQACRGVNKDRGVRRTQTDGKSLSSMDLCANVTEEPPAFAAFGLHVRPSNEDILICYSTVPGFVSNRDTERGTWYVQCLCETFMEHAHDTEISAMLRKVSKKMGQISSEYGEKQMCSFKNIGFHRELYFNPGLFERESVENSNG